MNKIHIDGQEYVVVAEKEYSYNGKLRTAITLRKPAGKKLYEVVRYENGSFSSVI